MDGIFSERLKIKCRVTACCDRSLTLQENDGIE